MTGKDEGFEAASGWSFHREDEGAVRIVAPDSMGPGAHQAVTLDADTWAAVVASMSRHGKVGGITFTLDPSPSVDELTRLVAAWLGGPDGGAMRA